MTGMRLCFSSSGRRNLYFMYGTVGGANAE